VDVFSGPAFIWAELVCQTLRVAGKPYILTLHGGNLPAFAQRWPTRVKRLLRSASAVTTPSRYLLEQMAEYHPGLQLLPNPLTITAYSFRPRNVVQPSLMWLRSFHRIYNPTLGPRVLAELLPDFPNTCLTMVGPDRGDGSLVDTRETAATLGVTKHLLLPGKIRKEEVSDWLNKGDIFINTANVDNTPISVLEAMACGLCVVSTSVGGMPYVIDHEHDGLLVPQDDSAALASAIRRILREPSLARRLSTQARQKAELFDWSNTLPKWNELFSSVLRNRTDTNG
jgi:glycosyltransferase involved in cell wall biosynthesis